MSRKKRNLFRELLAGIRAMRDQAEGKLELPDSQREPLPHLAGRRSRASIVADAASTQERVANVGHTRSASTNACRAGG
jgi:hypothetical protein